MILLASAPRTVAIVSEKSSSILKSLRYEGKFFIAHVMDDVVTEQTMESLPPHITLLPPFRALGCTAVAGFLETIKDVEALEAHIGERVFGKPEYYGDENEVPVRPIVGEGALSLMAIHVLFLARFRSSLCDLSYVGQHYHPHMTIKSEENDPGEGASINVDSACLIYKPESGGFMIYSADKFGHGKN